MRKNTARITIIMGLIIAGALFYTQIHLANSAVNLPVNIAMTPQSRDETISEVEKYIIQRYGALSSNQLETELSSLGSISGFGCQMAVRETLLKPGLIRAVPFRQDLTPQEGNFVILTTTNGQKFYFGNQINAPLIDGPGMTVWGLMKAAILKTGSHDYPDVVAIARYNASTVGSPAFGIPQLPLVHMPKELPIQALRKTWPDIRKIFEAHQIKPIYWGWIPAMAAQKLVIENKNKIPSTLAVQIVMEAALPMSKMDPAVITP